MVIRVFNSYNSKLEFWTGFLLVCVIGLLISLGIAVFLLESAGQFPKTFRLPFIQEAHAQLAVVPDPDPIPDADNIRNELLATLANATAGAFTINTTVVHEDVDSGVITAVLVAPGENVRNASLSEDSLLWQRLEMLLGFELIVYNYDYFGRDLLTVVLQRAATPVVEEEEQEEEVVAAAAEEEEEETTTTTTRISDDEEEDDDDTDNGDTENNDDTNEETNNGGDSFEPNDETEDDNFDETTIIPPASMVPQPGLEPGLE